MFKIKFLKITGIVIASSICAFSAIAQENISDYTKQNESPINGYLQDDINLTKGEYFKTNVANENKNLSRNQNKGSNAKVYNPEMISIQHSSDKIENPTNK